MSEIPHIKPYKLKHTPKTALVIATPGLGDGLLATPLVRSLHAAYPGIEVDMLVRSPAVSILQDIPEIRNVLCFDYKNKILSYLAMVRKIFRKYDLAISTSVSDRATLCCLYAAPNRVAAVPPPRPQDWWKRRILNGWAELDLTKHTLTQNMMLADVLEISGDKTVLLPSKFNTERIKKQLGFDFQNKTYAIIHCFPSLQNKKWPVENWGKVIQHLANKGLYTILTGGPSEEESNYASKLHNKFPKDTLVAAGKLNFSDLVFLLKKGTVYIGVDTSVSHIASLVDIPAICLFGPSNLVKWSPWPNGYTKNEAPFNGSPGVQKVGKLAVVRGGCTCGIFPANCTQVDPTENSLCMRSITPETVTTTLDELVGENSEVTKPIEASVGI